HWGGFRVHVFEIEFWQGQQNRFHDRWVFRRSDVSHEPADLSVASAWSGVRLCPCVHAKAEASEATGPDETEADKAEADKAEADETEADETRDKRVWGRCAAQGGGCGTDDPKRQRREIFDAHRVNAAGRKGHCVQGGGALEDIGR